MIRLSGVLGLSLDLRRLGLLCALACCLGCGRRGPEDHLRLSGLDSPLISPETALEIVGEELPTGQRLAVELRGVLAAVGQDPRSLQVSLLGQVLAPERLSVALDSDLVRSWGRAGFEGEIRVSCEANAARRCRGLLKGVSFDVEAADPRRSQRQRHRVVEQMLPALGLTVSDSESAARGVLLSGVEPGSLAARADLHEGDTLVRSNGVSLHALSDLAPGPSASALLLRVQRASGQQESVRLALASAAPLADPRTLGLCVLACPALLLLLGFAPLPAPGATLSLLAARSAAAYRGAGRQFGLGGLLCLLLAAAAVIWRQPPDAFWLLAMQLGCVLGLQGIRRAGWGKLLSDVLGLWLAAASAAAISGTRSWEAIALDQLGGPWAWNALSRPPLLLALILTLLHGARLRRPAVGAWGMTLDGASRALIAVLCAGLFLGGSQLQADAAGFALFAGCALFCIKALLCYALMVALPRLPLTRTRRAVLWGSLCCASLLWPWLSPGRTFELLLGSVLCVFGVFWLLIGLWQQRRAQLMAAAARPPRIRTTSTSAPTNA